MSAPAAVIHDIRYSRFAGTLNPRWRSVVSLAQSSGLRALGVRRTAGAKVWPFLLVLAAFLPAVIAVGVPLILTSISTPADLFSLSQMLATTSIVVLAFVATTLPSLLTRDRHDRTLTLYFSTAVATYEYVLGKILAAISLVMLVTFGPLLVMLLGDILVAKQPGSWAQHHLDWFGRAFVAGLIIAVFHASIGLALGAMTNRRVFAVGGYVALMLVPAGLGAVFTNITGSRNYLALDLLHVPIALAQRVLPGQDALIDFPQGPLLWLVWGGVLLFGAGVLVLRYHKAAEQ